MPDSVSSLPSLQTLDLCSNKFSRIERGTLAAMPRIRRLKLSNNFVSEIDRGALEHLEHLGQLENYIYLFILKALLQGQFVKNLKVWGKNLDLSKLLLIGSMELFSGNF